MSSPTSLNVSPTLPVSLPLLSSSSSSSSPAPTMLVRVRPDSDYSQDDQSQDGSLPNDPQSYDREMSRAEQSYSGASSMEVATGASSILVARRIPQEELIQSIQNLIISLEKFKNIESLDSNAATHQAWEVYHSARKFKDIIWETSGSETNSERIFLQTLKAMEIPYPLIRKFVKVTTADAFQFSHGLKRELSKTTCLFIQLLLFRCAVDNSRIYQSTFEKTLERIQKVLTTLPEKEVETWFALKCCEAAWQNLDPGRGKWKELARDESKGLLIGIAKSMLHRNPAEAVEPIVNISIRIYKNLALQTKWYRDAWMFSWGQQPQNLEEFNKVARDTQQAASKKSRLYIPFVAMMKDILQNDNTLPDLQDRILSETHPSLLTLAGMKSKRYNPFSNTWRVRSLALDTIFSIAEGKRHEYRLIKHHQEACLAKFVDCFRAENNPTLRDDLKHRWFLSDLPIPNDILLSMKIHHESIQNEKNDAHRGKETSKNLRQRAQSRFSTNKKSRTAIKKAQNDKSEILQSVSSTTPLNFDFKSYGRILTEEIDSLGRDLSEMEPLLAQLETPHNRERERYQMEDELIDKLKASIEHKRSRLQKKTDTLEDIRLGEEEGFSNNVIEAIEEMLNEDGKAIISDIEIAELIEGYYITQEQAMTIEEENLKALGISLKP